jgi:hypothetical protein
MTLGQRQKKTKTLKLVVMFFLICTQLNISGYHMKSIEEVPFHFGEYLTKVRNI